MEAVDSPLAPASSEWAEYHMRALRMERDAARAERDASNAQLAALSALSALMAENQELKRQLHEARERCEKQNADLIQLGRERIALRDRVVAAVARRQQEVQRVLDHAQQYDSEDVVRRIQALPNICNQTVRAELADAFLYRLEEMRCIMHDAKPVAWDEVFGIALNRQRLTQSAQVTIEK